MKELTVLNWNIDGFSARRQHDHRKLSHILSFDWDVLTVQEVARSTHKLIAAEADFATEVDESRDFNALRRC